MKLVVGLVGRKRSGKDTVALFARDLLPGVNVLSFADPLKKACKHAYCLSDEQLEATKDVVDPRWGMTPRDMMKDLGCKYFRHADPEHWTKNMGVRMQGVDNVIITDVRFQNEASFVKKNGGILVHVTRDLESNADDHVSEKTTDDIVCEYSIRNDGTLMELREKFVGVLQELLLDVLTKKPAPTKNENNENDKKALLMKIMMDSSL
jgi:hypothetical protein